MEEEEEESHLRLGNQGEAVGESDRTVSFPRIHLSNPGGEITKREDKEVWRKTKEATRSGDYSKEKIWYEVKDLCWFLFNILSSEHVTELKERERATASFTLQWWSGLSKLPRGGAAL